MERENISPNAVFRGEDYENIDANLIAMVASNTLIVNERVAIGSVAFTKILFGNVVACQHGLRGTINGDIVIESACRGRNPHRMNANLTQA